MSTQISQIIEEAANNIKDMSPGTVLPHLVVSELLDVDRLAEKQTYYNRVSKLSKELKRQWGIFLRTEYNVGYVIAQPGNEVDLCEDKFLRGVKVMNRAVVDANFIRIDNIKDTDKRRRTIDRAQLMANKVGLIKLGTVDRQQII